MTLMTSFTHPMEDFQHTFRRILRAMSEPGLMVMLPLQQGWGDLSPAATAALLTLVDHDTTLWLDPMLDNESLRNDLRLHIGVPLCSELSTPFAISRASADPDPLSFTAGDDRMPKKSTTLIIDLPSLSGGLTLRLKGPGIQETRAIAPQLPPRVLHYLRERPHHFPQSLDLIFTCGETMMAVPRTIRVEVC